MCKRNKIRRNAVLFFSILVLCVVIVGTVFADDPRTTYTGWVGKVVRAQKDVTRSGTSWNGRLWSHTSDGTTIGTIGWTYWTHRELCNWTIGDNYVHLGFVQYNSSGVSDIGVDSISTCPGGGTKRGQVLGNHEFKNSGFPDWRKDWTHTEVLQ